MPISFLHRFSPSQSASVCLQTPPSGTHLSEAKINVLLTQRTIAIVEFCVCNLFVLSCFGERCMWPDVFPRVRKRIHLDTVRERWMYDPILTKGALSGSRPNLSLLQRTRLLWNESLLKVSPTPPCRCCLGSHQHDRWQSRCFCCSPRPVLAH